MPDGLRTIRVLTTDEALLASARCAAEAHEGWEVVQVETQQQLAENPPIEGDLLLIDAWSRGENVYEFCRRLTGRTHCQTFVVVEHFNELAAPIARFCGATGVLCRPITRSDLSGVLSERIRPPAPLPAERRGQGAAATEMPESLLRDIQTGQQDQTLVKALIDPATGLFNYAFLNYKLDEEFKRASRFDHPLACVMLGIEGQAEDDVLRELAGIFLSSSRDTDILGRFDESSFLFLLPDTGPDGAAIMAHRVAEQVAERGLKDLVGDALEISVGISHYPNPDMERREDLYGTARDAFLTARNDGGGVVVAS